MPTTGVSSDQPSSSQPIGLAGWRRATTNPTARQTRAATVPPAPYAARW